MSDMIAAKWCWMMDFCRAQGWPPADSTYWRKAEAAYREHIESGRDQLDRTGEADTDTS